MTEVVRRMNQRILSGERANEDPIAREFKMDAADFSIRYDLAHEKAFLKAIDEGFAAVGVVADGQGNFTIKIYGQEDVLIRGPGEEI